MKGESRNERYQIQNHGRRPAWHGSVGDKGGDPAHLSAHSFHAPAVAGADRSQNMTFPELLHGIVVSCVGKGKRRLRW